MTTTLVGRIGLALIRPRIALALAGDRDRAGRAGADLIVAILVFLLATQLRALVAAAWLGAAIDVVLGLRAAVQTLTDALVVDLGVLVLAAIAIWAASGRLREPGRSFDLACVVVLPLVYVELAASVVVHAANLELPRTVMWGLSGLAYAWSGVLLVFAIIEGRRRSRASDPITRVGWLLVAVAVAGIGLQVMWIVRHLDQVRPIRDGDRAPPFALHRIADSGALGERVTLPAGRVVVLDFWATWCGPCLKAMPKLDAFARRNPDIAVFAINIDDSAAARALFNQRGYMLTLLAGDQATSDRYRVTSIPHTVLIDRSGFVRYVFRGSVSGIEREAVLLK